MKKKILIVDDSATVRQQVGMALIQAGFEVLMAADGQIGADTINANSDIGVVICDVNMPNLNGIDMVEMVKRDPRHADLPIVMLTTEGQLELIRRAKQAGARGWIVKPFKAEQLVSAVRKLSAA